MTARPCCALLLLALVLSMSAPAGAVTVRGRVAGGTGYLIAGTSAAGEGVSQKLGTAGTFALVFPGTSAAGASLQLVGPDGHYFGPVVLRHRGRTAYLTLAGRSVNLGPITLADGYARAKRQAAARVVDRRHVASADASGRPVGAGRLGVVAAAPGGSVRRAGSPGQHEQGADDDGDGIINAFDADDDGDLVLDNNDQDNSGESGGIFSTLFVDLAQSLNANIGEVTAAAIDAIIADHLNLIFFFDDGQFPDETIASADVDCFTLPYCARGTGTAIMGGLSESSPDLPRGQPWINYDPNGDGLPNLEPIVSHDGHSVHAASILPHATTAEMAPGDAYTVIFTTATGTHALPRSLPPYFVTTPAVVSYDAGAGPQTVTYPVASGAPGTGGNPIAMTSESLTLTLYRPQRPGIAGAESAAYVDVGHLHYGIPLDVNNQEVACAGDYSGLSPTLTAADGSGGDFALQLFPLTDAADDAAPDPARTISFTIDLGSCLRRAGADPTGLTISLGITATGESRPGGVDRTAQMLNVRLPG